MLNRQKLACALLIGVTGQALALDPGSSMQDWGAAPAADRKALLEKIGPSLSSSFKAEEAEIMNCLDQAGENSAHASLSVAEVAKGCVAFIDAGRTPAGQQDI